MDNQLRELTELGEEYPYNEKAISDLGLLSGFPEEVRDLSLRYLTKICKVCGFLYAEINKDSIDSLRKGLEGVILPETLKRDLLRILQKAGEIKRSFKIPLKEGEFIRLFASILSSWSKKPRDFWLRKDMVEKVLFSALQVEIKDSQIRSLMIQIFLNRDKEYVKFANQALKYFGMDHSFVICKHAIPFGTESWEGRYPHIENYFFKELNLPKKELEFALTRDFLDDPKNISKFISTDPDKLAEVFKVKEPKMLSFLERIRQDLWILGLDMEIKGGLIIKLGVTTFKKVPKINSNWMIGIFFDESSRGKWQSFAIPRDRYFDLDKSRLTITQWWPSIKKRSQQEGKMSF